MGSLRSSFVFISGRRLASTFQALIPRPLCPKWSEPQQSPCSIVQYISISAYILAYVGIVHHVNPESYSHIRGNSAVMRDSTNYSNSFKSVAPPRFNDARAFYSLQANASHINLLKLNLGNPRFTGNCHGMELSRSCVCQRHDCRRML